MSHSQADNSQQQTVKGEKQTILLGDISLSVFQVPDGEYRLSKTQILEVIGEKTNWLSRLQSATPNILKALQEKGFTGYSVKVQISLERGSTRAETLSIPDAMRVWGYFARHGNVIALYIFEACGVEAIERRADKVFGVKRTEEAYNQRFAVRMNLKKEKYQAFVSAIHTHLENLLPLRTHSLILTVLNPTESGNSSNELCDRECLALDS